jgi:N-acetylmuramoyl-L-alanine amidase
MLVLAVTATLLSGCGESHPEASAPPSALTQPPAPAPAPPEAEPSARRAQGHQVLDGKVIVIDPGHQLGNATHPRQVNRLVNAGGFTKACNTTGTATNGGFPEATFTWKVALALRTQLRRHGATVVLTRHTNSNDDWGPCIDVRGRRGNRVHADAVVSIHGDGAAASTHGFFVIMPTKRRGWTDDIFRSSHRLGHRMKAGLMRAGVSPSTSYGGDGLDSRGDLGTLNWSNRPIVMIELGNMRNAHDARHMTTPKFRRHAYARGLRIGLTDFVRHR